MSDLGVSISFNQIAQYNAQLQSVSSSTLRAMRRIDNSTKSAQAAFSQLRTEVPLLGRAFTLARNPIVLLGASVAATGKLFADAVGTARKFEAQFKTTAAIVSHGLDSKVAQANLKVLREEALKLGSTTEFSATQAAQGMEALARAGFNTKEVIDATSQALSLASVENISLKRSAEIVSGTLRQFGLDTAEAGRAVDIITKTTLTANTTAELWAQSMKFLGPTARAMGISIEESSAIIGILANNNIRGSLATRALGTSMANLAAPMGRAKKELQKLNIDAFDTRGNFVGMAGLIEKLERSFVGLTQKEQQAALVRTFGAESLQEMNTLLSKGSKELKRYTKEIEAAGKRNGALAKEIRKQKLDTLEGAVINLKSAWEGFQIAITDGVLPSLKEITSYTADVVRGATKMVRAIKDNADIIGIAVAAIAVYNGQLILTSANILRAVVAEKAATLILTLKRAVLIRATAFQITYNAAVFASSGIMARAAAAMRGLIAVMAVNPFTAVAVAIAAIGAAWVAYDRATNEAAAATRRMAAVTSDVISEFTNEAIVIQRAFNALRKYNASQIDQAEIIGQLRQKYGDLLPAYVRAGASLKDLHSAQEALTKARIKDLLSKQTEKKIASDLAAIAELTAKKRRIEREGLEGNIGALKTILRQAQSVGLAAGAIKLSPEQFEIAAIIDDLARLRKSLGKTSELLSPGVINDVYAGTKAIEKYVGLTEEAATKPVVNTGEIKAAIGSLSALNSEISKLGERISKAAPTSGLIPSLQRQLNSFKQKLANTKLSELRLDVGLNTSAVNAEIERLQAKVVGINIEPTASSKKEISLMQAKIKALQDVHVRFRTEGTGAIDIVLNGLIKKRAKLEKQIKLSSNPQPFTETKKAIEDLSAQIEALNASKVEIGPTFQINTDKAQASIEQEISKLNAEIRLKADTSGIEASINSMRAKIKSLEAVKLRIETVKGLDSTIAKIRDRFSEIREQVSISVNTSSLEEFKTAIRQLSREVLSLNNQRIELKGESLESLTAKAGAFRDALKGIAPNAGIFSEVQARIKELDAQIFDTRLFQIKASGDKSLGALNAELSLLKSRLDAVNPDPGMLTPLINQIKDVEREIGNVNRLKVQIEAGIVVDALSIARLSDTLPTVKIPARLDFSAAGEIARLAVESAKITAEPLNSMTEAANNLGLSLSFVKNTFRDVADLQSIMSSNSYQIALGLGAVGDSAAYLAIELQRASEQIKRGLGTIAIRSVESFGDAMGAALSQGLNFHKALSAGFSALLAQLLRDIPKLVGITMIQIAPSVPFPGSLAFLAGGVGLLGLSGILPSLVGGGQENQRPLSPTDIAAQNYNTGSSGRIRTASGLSGLNAGDQRPTVINLTNVIESDGIITEIERRRILAFENEFGG